MTNIQVCVKWPQLLWRRNMHSPRGGNLESKDNFLRLVACLGPNQMHWLVSVSFLFHEKGKLIAPFPQKCHANAVVMCPLLQQPPEPFPLCSPTQSPFVQRWVWKCSWVWTGRVLLLWKAPGLFWQFGFCLDLHRGNASVYLWKLSLPQMTEEIQCCLMLLLIFRSIPNLIYICQWRATLFCTEFCLEQPWASFLWVSLCRRPCMSPKMTFTPLAEGTGSAGDPSVRAGSGRASWQWAGSCEHPLEQGGFGKKIPPGPKPQVHISHPPSSSHMDHVGLGKNLLKNEAGIEL